MACVTNGKIPSAMGTLFFFFSVHITHAYIYCNFSFADWITIILFCTVCTIIIFG